MSSTLIRTKEAQNYYKLNVFERLTMKKNSQDVNPMTKSHLTTKQKTHIPSIPQTSRSTISSKKVQKKHQKEIQKLTLPSYEYSYVIFPVQYAENGLVIEIQSEVNKNVCKIQMDYNQYQILVNEIQHHFTMPIMEMCIKVIKVNLSEHWFPKCRINISRIKGKIKEDKIETNTVYNLFSSKELIEIDPFKEIEESELRRKKMLLNIPRLKIDKIFAKTEVDEITNEDSASSKLILLDMEQGSVTTKKSLNTSDLFSSPSPHRKLIKNDFFKLLTPRSRLLASPLTEKSKIEQKPIKKLTFLDQTMPSMKNLDNYKKNLLVQKQKADTKTQQVTGNIKVLSSVTKSKGNIYCSPRRF